MPVGPGEFISEDTVQLNEWTTVIAERNRNDGSLIVNEATAVKGLASSLLSELLSRELNSLDYNLILLSFILSLFSFFLLTIYFLFILL